MPGMWHFSDCPEQQVQERHPATGSGEHDSSPSLQAAETRWPLPVCNTKRIKSDLHRCYSAICLNVITRSQWMLLGDLLP